MKIGLVDVDGHLKKKKYGATIYPNLALAKIARYHSERGDEVEWAIPFYHYDKVYMAKVFNFSPFYCDLVNIHIRSDCSLFARNNTPTTLVGATSC